MSNSQRSQFTLPFKKRGRPISKVKSEKFRTRSGLVAHIPRPVLVKTTPIHINIKLKSHLPSLRTKKLYKIFRAAVKKAREQKLAIIHFALLSNHLHLIVEASSNPELTKMMRSFLISLAMRINVVAKAQGGVFTDRYHLELIKYPQRMQHLLRYVFQNYARHCGKDRSERKAQWADPYSSIFALLASERKLLFGMPVILKMSPDKMLHELLTPAKTWLAKVGWQKNLANS